MNNIPADAHVYLEGFTAGDIVNLTTTSSYSCYISDTETEPRFQLMFMVVPTSFEKEKSNQQNTAFISPNPVINSSVLQFKTPITSKLVFYYITKKGNKHNL
ncbi:MAG: hypothetical protein HRT71_13830 [Flavobacteriales bacterium]|nr:hypothetical protein [Flavobacteriales bacterium]